MEAHFRGSAQHREVWNGSVLTEQLDPLTHSAGFFFFFFFIFGSLWVSSASRGFFCSASSLLWVFCIDQAQCGLYSEMEGFEEMEIYGKDFQEREKWAKEMERKWKWCLAKLRKIAGIWWIGWERMKKLHSSASSASFHSSVPLSSHLFCFPQSHSALN